jgi:hypothetical protein
MIPIEEVDGRYSHGLVYANVAVAHVDEEEYEQATIEERSKAMKRAYVMCLHSAIEKATEKLAALADGELCPQYLDAARRMVASFEQGHDVLLHGGDGNE